MMKSVIVQNEHLLLLWLNDNYESSGKTGTQVGNKQKVLTITQLYMWVYTDMEEVGREGERESERDMEKGERDGRGEMDAQKTDCMS